MGVRVSKKFDFDAAHKLPNVPEGHKCGHLHGHTYVVELILIGEVNDKSGWFIDYADIATAWEPIGKMLDHKYLNEIEGLQNPTTEVLVQWVANRLCYGVDGAHVQRLFQFLETVRIYESSTTWCEVAVKEPLPDV